MIGGVVAVIAVHSFGATFGEGVVIAVVAFSLGDCVKLLVLRVPTLPATEKGFGLRVLHTLHQPDP